jgi:glycosyltransferase involved in cell wall biosynthesis
LNLRQLEPSVSVVVPVHNEERHLERLYEELRATMDRLGKSWEILFVDDGSDDDTLRRLESLQAVEPRLRVLELDDNYGEAAALSAGFHAARGGVIVTLDGDRQNDPADIPSLLAALDTPGIAVVSGRRIDRKEDKWRRVLPSRIANALIASVTGIPVNDCGCGLKAYRRTAIPSLHLPRGMHRFLPAILGVEPGSVAEVPARDRPRRHGTSHYGIGRTLAVLRDLPALPFLIRNPHRSEVRFALATAGAAALGAVAVDTSVAATVVFDGIAVVLGLVWWNTRRFNRTQTAGAYRIRRELLAMPSASAYPRDELQSSADGGDGQKPQGS